MNTPWISETNWNISRGSLNSAVTFESFDFPIESESTVRKPPLHLVPTSQYDFEPCEIKLNFTQKHEIRQVYVRSTARVYEIYCAPALQSDNEYLCTVRCSTASVEDNETTSVNWEGSNVILPKERVAGENKVGTNEDDWVEVKLPARRVGEGNDALPNQDYYEATAEINNSEPCMSLTLRLLSLRTKDCVYVDEVYVFADPIDTNDPENQTESSAGTSLMTMLVPTLIGLTKSRSLNQNSVIPAGKPLETEPKHATSTNPVFVDQQNEKSLKHREPKAELTQLQLPGKDNRAEVLLEQLVSRVSRIEDICLRFEENMLKPINSIETRLERVEQQVELLTKKSHCLSCPGFDPNPRSTTSEDGQLWGEFKLEKENGTNEPPEEDTFVAESTQVHKSPCCFEKEEANDFLELPKTELPKKTISIDDALAAALAGFSSSTKSNNDDFTVVPFESPEEEECLKSNQDCVGTTLGSNSDGDSSISCESTTETALGFTGEEISCNASIKISDNSFHVQGTSEVADEEEMGCIPYLSCSSPHDNYKIDAHHFVKQDSVKVVKILTFDKTDILKHFPDEQVATSPNGEVNNTVDFESPILEVKFASLENGSHKSYVEALLSNTEDTITDEGVINMSAIEEKTTNGNNLLVDFDGDYVGEGAGVQTEDIPPVQPETSFTSLI